MTERKLITDLFKMAAYRIETELHRMLAAHRHRAADEDRKLLVAAMCSSADLEVTAGELRVTIADQSSPHRSRSIAALCADLNKQPVLVPGTNLRLRLACRRNLLADVAAPA